MTRFIGKYGSFCIQELQLRIHSQALSVIEHVVYVQLLLTLLVQFANYNFVYSRLICDIDKWAFIRCVYLWCLKMLNIIIHKFIELFMYTIIHMFICVTYSVYSLKCAACVHVYNLLHKHIDMLPCIRVIVLFMFILWYKVGIYVEIYSTRFLLCIPCN